MPARMPNIPAIEQEARTLKPVNKRVWREDKALIQRNLKPVRNNFDVKKGYVTIKCGNDPKVALSKLSGDNILLASSIQRQPR